MEDNSFNKITKLVDQYQNWYWTSDFDDINLTSEGIEILDNLANKTFIQTQTRDNIQVPFRLVDGSLLIISATIEPTNEWRWFTDYISKENWNFVSDFKHIKTN